MEEKRISQKLSKKHKEVKANFYISIDDNYCVYKFPLNVSENNSIGSIYKKICKTFRLKEREGELLKIYKEIRYKV